MTQSAAWGVYDRWLNDERIIFLEEPPEIEPSFRSLSRRPHSDSRLWADAYLAAFATVEGMLLVTFDRGFEGMLEDVLILRP